MKKIIAFFSLLALLAPFMSAAQPAMGSVSPVMWDFSATKIEEGSYRLEAKAILQPGFHIWALDAGGDGSLIATALHTEDIGDAVWKTAWQESKEPVVQRLEFIEGAIRWHEKEITFYREIAAPAGQVITGTVMFQTCNDKMCFPPEELGVAIELPE